MPEKNYIVELDVTSTYTWLVKAKSKADAIKKADDGHEDAEPLGDSEISYEGNYRAHEDTNGEG